MVVADAVVLTGGVEEGGDVLEVKLLSDVLAPVLSLLNIDLLNPSLTSVRAVLPHGNSPGNTRHVLSE